MHKSSIYLPEPLKAELAGLAARSGRSEAQLVRQAIERLLAGTGDGRRGDPTRHARAATTGRRWSASASARAIRGSSPGVRTPCCGTPTG